MKFLLPHQLKFVGAVCSPLGFACWAFMQLGYVSKLAASIFGSVQVSTLNIINSTVAIVSFFTFLGGVYLLTFSKEKIEDEMVQRIRLDSFQFAAFIQLLSIIGGFVVFLFSGDPGESGLMSFFILLVCLFYISFIARFNYVLHFNIKA